MFYGEFYENYLDYQDWRIKKGKWIWLVLLSQKNRDFGDYQ
jgi:hypothetical protein